MSGPLVEIDAVAPEGDRAARAQTAKEFEQRSYDPSQDRERTRGKIPERLVWTLIGLIVATFVLTALNMALCMGPACNAAANLEAVKTIVTLLFTPVVGLVGAVTGFYYGAKSKDGA